MHILVLFSFLLFLTILLSNVQDVFVFVTSIPVIIFFGLAAPAIFSRLTARLKWIWLTLPILYAVWTPGEYVFVEHLQFLAMTYEGIFEGALQALRLLAILAVIGFIQQRFDSKAIMSGLYQALARLPFSQAILQKMVVRIFLVLESQNHFEKLTITHLTEYFKNPSDLLNIITDDKVTLHVQPLKLIEKLMMAIMLSCAIWLVLNRPL